MNKVLIITYYWPPSGGAGVQRWLKFSKYLPEFNWEPVILTVDPIFAVYPVIDDSLNTEIPDNIRIYQTKATNWFRLYAKDKSIVPSAGFAKNNADNLKGKISRFIRGNFFIPDPRKGWNRFAYKKAIEIIENEQIRYVITTSPPHSSQLIGLKLKKRFPGIKWIADFRDPWTDIYYYSQFLQTPLAKYIDSRYEKKVIRGSDLIISVGKTLSEILAKKTGDKKCDIQIIPNGFDEEDFSKIKIKTPDKFTITYIGTLTEAYPIEILLVALQKIKNKNHAFILRFVGLIPEYLKRKIIDLLGEENTEFLPYVSHIEAIEYMADSSLLLLLTPEHEHNRLIITGKLFEYSAIGKEILFIGPVDGDAADYLRLYGHNGIFSCINPVEIEKFLVRNMISEKMPAFSKHPEFTRKALTKKLSEILNKI